MLMGGSTFVVSLPSEWVRKYGILKGDELEVEESGSQVVVKTEKKQVDTLRTYDFSSFSSLLSRAVGAIYKAGYDEVKIIFRDQQQLEQIEKTLSRTCVGFEIVRQEKNFVIVKCIAPENPEEFDVSFRKMFFTLRMMFEALEEGFRTQNQHTFSSVIEKDDNANRSADFCRRILNRHTQSFADVHLYYYLVEELERLGDLNKKLASYALHNETPKDLEIVSLIHELLQYFQTFEQLFYDFSFEKVESFGVQHSHLQGRISGLKKKDSTVQFFIWSMIETIFDMNGVVLTMKL